MSTATPSALFGLFAAQVTGSFVIAGAELVTHDYGTAGKLIAIVAFVVAAALTAALIALARDTGRAALPWMLALEAALLAVFAAIVLFGPSIKTPPTGAASSPACSRPWPWACKACWCGF